MAPVQVVLTWSFREGRSRSGMEYVAETLGPTLFRLELRVAEAWYRQAGTGPELVLVILIDDLPKARAIIADPLFQRLRRELGEHAETLTCRIEPVALITLF